MQKRIIVVGAGPAGMMASIMAARSGMRVLLLEKNEKCGKKLFITGKGRCNLTNDCDPEIFFDNVITNKRFLYSAFYGFDNEAVKDFFSELRLPLKTERGNRVFPASDHSSDVIKVLEKELLRLGVEIRLNTRVSDILFSKEGGEVCGVMLENGGKEEADALILALGGASYPSTGSDGETDKLLKDKGIVLIKEEPSLVPLVCEGEDMTRLQGLSLKNVALGLFVDEKKRYGDFGELLFTHFGLSGPLVLSASCRLKEEDYEKKVEVSIDLKPALSAKKLDERILRDFEKNKNKKLVNSLFELLPSKLIPFMIEKAGLDPDKPVNSITREERGRLCSALKDLRFSVCANRGFNEAIITRGGVSVKEIDPSTMRLKSFKNLYLAGEMIDVDACTGGFNLQIAWSTGALAGRSVIEG